LAVHRQPLLEKACITTVEDLTALLHVDEEGDRFFKELTKHKVRACQALRLGGPTGGADGLSGCASWRQVPMSLQVDMFKLRETL
jgi:hypothetical protein